MEAYSQDLRDRVLRALERGERPTAIAARFEVSRVWVYQVQNRLTQPSGIEGRDILARRAPGWPRSAANHQPTSAAC